MFSLAFPACFPYLELLRSVVLGLDGLYQDAEVRPEREQVYAWNLAVYEAATNVIRHGYGGEGDGCLTLTIEPLPDRVVFTLRDHGRSNGAWPEADLPAPEPAAEHGYGMYVIKSVMSETHYFQDASGANVLVMTARFPAPPA